MGVWNGIRVGSIRWLVFLLVVPFDGTLCPDMHQNPKCYHLQNQDRRCSSQWARHKAGQTYDESGNLLLPGTFESNDVGYAGISHVAHQLLCVCVHIVLFLPHIVILILSRGTINVA